MVNVLYGICGEGMGHATRSAVVIAYLQKQGHVVHICTSARAYDYLSATCTNMYKIKGFYLTYQKDKVSNLETAKNFLSTLPKDFIPTIKLISGIIADKKIDVIISDFEFFTDILGKVYSIPVIATSNISLIDKTKLDTREIRNVYPKILTVTTDRLANFDANMYVIPTFVKPKVTRKNVILTDPTIRKVIVDAPRSSKNHILVYQTSKTAQKILRIIEQLPTQQFIVYGFGALKHKRNITFKAFDEVTFAKDLAACKAVITGGGQSLISEAIYLHKPLLCIPLKQHFEQICNAYYVKKCKFGTFHLQPTKDDVLDFMLSLPLYTHYISQIQIDPTQYLKTIAQQVEKLALKKKAKIGEVLLSYVLNFMHK